MKARDRKYFTLKFRNFCGKDREGFVLFVNQKLPEVVLEDIAFQLFEPLYPHILCPEVYYFTNGQELLTAEQLYDVDGFIYVHFLQRVQNYKEEGRLSRKIKICDLKELSRGISISGCRLFIFSEKQYAVYSNSKYCQIVRQRITDINHAYDRVITSSGQLSDILSHVVMKNEEETQMDFLKKEVLFVNENKFLVDKIEMELTRASVELQEILKETGISLYTLEGLKPL